MSDIELFSPSAKYALELTYAGEVHFGAAFFTVQPQGFPLDSRVSPITEEVLWSKNEEYLCLVVIVSVSNSVSSELYVVSTKTGKASLIEQRNSQITVNHVSDNGQVEYVVRNAGRKIVKRT